MKRAISLLILSLVMLIPSAGVALAGIDIGLSADEDGIKSFRLAICDHYGVPEHQVVAAREAKVFDEELPVVFFLAARTGKNPALFIDLHHQGMSWMDISLKYGLDAETFYVPVKHNPGPPYGKAYGHFNKRKRSEWKSIRLSDSDIVNLVNLKFLSQQYGYSVDDIIKWRSSGDSFMKINAKVKQKKNEEKKKLKKESADKGNSKKKGKGK